MKTQFFNCDICKNEIKEKMSVFIWNETLVNKDLQITPVSKQADFCDECSNKIITAIDEIAKKVEEQLSLQNEK